MVRITDEEFARVGDKQAAVMMAMGAASVCWNPSPGDGVFDSERAADIADDLIRYLEVPAGVSKEEAAWLLTLVDNAVPAGTPGSPMDWEGRGRAQARKILQRVVDGGAPAPVELVGSDR